MSTKTELVNVALYSKGQCGRVVPRLEERPKGAKNDDGECGNDDASEMVSQSELARPFCDYTTA